MGKSINPWDNLFNCPKCNSSHVWMEDKNGTCNVFLPIRIRCLDCNEKTKYGEILEVRSIWSNGKDTWGSIYRKLLELSEKGEVNVIILTLDDINSAIETLNERNNPFSIDELI